MRISWGPSSILLLIAIICFALTRNWGWRGQMAL